MAARRSPRNCHCGRRLHTHYRGRNASPGYHCPGKVLVENRGVYCLNIGGIQIDEAVTRTFVAALEPAGLAATLAAAERLEAEREVALKQWRLGVERANYEAQRAERRYRAVDPDNRLVARGLERDWEDRRLSIPAGSACESSSRRRRASPRAQALGQRRAEAGFEHREDDLHAGRADRAAVPYPGDVTLTGAPAGVGAGRGEFLKPGDVVKLWIEKIGSLTNTMI